VRHHEAFTEEARLMQDRNRKEERKRKTAELRQREREEEDEDEEEAMITMGYTISEYKVYGYRYTSKVKV
jgi:hypothetical protein